ncbi:hypothetical protein UlMin_000163 [Ulmus minor]
MENPPTPLPAIVIGPPPPFPAEPRSVDLSALEFILGLIAVISIPALIYTCFFAIKCPPNPFYPRQSDHHSSGITSGEIEASQLDPSDQNPEPISDVTYLKETHSKDIGSECPVCLSAFADGEEVKQLSICKHSFHAVCIDPWLNSHSNCPVCRASVPVKRSSNTSNSRVSRRVDDDLHQGLPDASNLV